MTYIWMILAMSCFTGQLFSVKEYNAGGEKTGLSALFRFQAVMQYVSSILTLCSCFIFGFNGKLTGYTVLMGLIFGATFISFFYFFTTAMQTGPLSLTTLCNASANVIPIVVGLVFWHEHTSLFQWIGIALVVVMFYLSSTGGSGQEKPVSAKWIAQALIMMVLSGGCMVECKLYPMLIDVAQTREFYSIGFATAGTIALIVSLVTGKKSGQKEPVVWKRLLLFGGICGLTTSIGNQIMGLLSEMKVNASLLFPFVNGGQVVVTSLLAAIIYREKLTRRSLIAMAIGLVALVLMAF